MITRGAALVVVLHAGVAAAGVFHANPAVKVVEVPVNTAGNAPVQLVNDQTSDIVAGSIVAEPGCDAAVHAAPLSGFTLTPGNARTLTVSCAAAPAGMQRCAFTVRSPSDVVLLGFEAVCESAGPSMPLTSDMTLVDLGSVAIGTSATKTITLTNHGPPVNRLHFEATDPAGNFALGMPCNPDRRSCDPAIATVANGATTTAFVKCAPQTTGVLSASLYISTSAGTRLATPLGLTCTGTPATTPVLALAPTALDVGAVEVIGSTAGTTVHLGNVGSGPLRLTGMQLVDAGTGAATDWSLTVTGACNGTPCNLDPGGQVDLGLVFDPSAIGGRNATLLVTYHDTADRSTSVPLRGLGRGVTLEALGGVTTLDFGVLPVNAMASLTLQLANGGNRDLTGATITMMPAGPPFTTAPTTTFNVSPTAATTLTVTCKPTATGMNQAMLELAATDALTPPIEIALACAGDAAATLLPNPAALNLGEVRTSTNVVKHIAITSTAAQVQLESAGLAVANPELMVTGAPAMTPAMLNLSVEPVGEGDLANSVVVTPASGNMLSLAVTGKAVTAAYSVPPAVSLGTFCVNQPTTARVLQLTSTGTATLGLTAPALVLPDSPFDLAFTSPSVYPARLPAMQKAMVELTPKRQGFAGTVTDDLIWATDIPGPDGDTTVTATFIDDGGAIAPPALNFGKSPIHLEIRNSQQVTVQNCALAAIEFDAPEIAAPFSIDSPTFPQVLMPGETTTFSVGFHPTKLGVTTQILRLSSTQLTTPLEVMMTGEGVTGGPDGDAGTDHPPHHDGGCCDGSGSPASPLVLLALVAFVLRRRSSSLLL